jgi:hypothetical protein
MAQSNAQRTETVDQQESATRRPVETARVGNVEIPIWRNQGANGDFFTRRHPPSATKDEKTGEWKDGNSYGALDLLALAEAAGDASAKIRELSKSKRYNRQRRRTGGRIDIELFRPRHAASSRFSLRTSRRSLLSAPDAHHTSRRRLQDSPPPPLSAWELRTSNRIKRIVILARVVEFRTDEPA